MDSSLHKVENTMNFIMDVPQCSSPMVPDVVQTEIKI